MFSYRYVRFKDQKASEQVSYLLLNSIVLSFVLQSMYSVAFLLVPKQLLSHRSTVFTLCLSVVCGYVSARLVSSVPVEIIRRRLSITRTPNENIWDDVIEPDLWVRVWLKNSERSYYGQIRYVEDYERMPIIVLENYQYLDEHANVLLDNTKDKARTVMLNLDQFERIEIASGLISSD